MTQTDRIEKKIDSMSGKLDSYSERITRLEVKVDGFIKIGTVILTAIITALIRLYFY